MKYLLVGNGDIPDLKTIALDANVIIQINTCRHAKLLPHTDFVLITNTDGKSGEILDHMPFNLEKVILARNPVFYKMKYFLMRSLKRSGAEYFLPDNVALPAVGLMETIVLEAKMFLAGMRPGNMPSTGCVAYYWAKNRLKKGDSLEVVGFTFEGWYRHPWHIEKQLVKSCRF